MTRRRELEQSLRKLSEIGEIMRSMKNLAVMETRKLSRFLEAQGEAVRIIEAAAADVLGFFPQLAPNHPPGVEGILVLGTERGFCGDFNDELLAGLDGASPILAVGGKLGARLEKHPALVGQFEGPTVAEDVPNAINRLVPEIGRLQQCHSCQGLSVLHHRSGEEGLSRKALLPPFSQSGVPKLPLPHPPQLNLAPEAFFAGLVRHYLFAALHEMFYSSLMAENQRRIQHLEGAIQRLEEKTDVLARTARTLRQEEITEEIEVILLSVEGSVVPKPGGWG